MAGTNLVNSVLKALDILRAVANSAEGGLRLRDIEVACGLKKTTAHNLLRTLQARGFIEKDAANRFAIGTAISELHMQITDRKTLQSAGRLMLRLQNEYPEATFTFSELTPSAIICRLRVSPDRPGELQTPSNMFFQPYLSQTAICLQATATRAGSLERQFPFEDFGAGRWRTRRKFDEKLREVLRSGYSAETTGSKMAVAFSVPDHFALGVRVSPARSGSLERLAEEADEWRRYIAGPDNDEEPR